MRFTYTYKNYTNAPNATKKSQVLGILTAIPMCLVYGFFWLAIVNAILLEIGLSDNASIFLAMVSLVLLYVIVKKIKSNISEKIDKQAIAEMQRSSGYSNSESFGNDIFM